MGDTAPRLVLSLVRQSGNSGVRGEIEKRAHRLEAGRRRGSQPWVTGGWGHHLDRAQSKGRRGLGVQEPLEGEARHPAAGSSRDVCFWTIQPVPASTERLPLASASAI